MSIDLGLLKFVSQGVAWLSAKIFQRQRNQARQASFVGVSVALDETTSFFLAWDGPLRELTEYPDPYLLDKQAWAQVQEAVRASGRRAILNFPDSPKGTTAYVTDRRTFRRCVKCEDPRFVVRVV